MSIGALRFAGHVGRLWLATTSWISIDAYYFDINTPNTFPSSYGGRWYGFTVCPKLSEP